jgi:sulfotransferase family protein
LNPASRASRTLPTPRLPDVLGVGPPRTGSTWLYNALREVLDMPDGVKEPQFFSRFYDKGIDWYARHFRYATGRRLVAEISPPYFFHAETPARVKAHIPNCKIVTTMRNPVDRIYSVYKLMRHYGWVRRGTLDEVLRVRPNLGGGNRYAEHLRTWFVNFGRDNVLVTMYDELRDDPQAYLNRVCDFIRVDRIALASRPDLGGDVNSFARAPKSRRLAMNAGKLMYWLKGRQAYGLINLLDRSGVWEFCGGRGEPYPRLTSEQEERLRERYLPEVEALEELLSVDLSAWKKPRAASPAVERQTPRVALG